jgi:hypothetical protein
VGEPTLWLPSLPPSGCFGLLAKYNFLLFFWNFPDLPKYGVLTVFFQQNPDSGSKSSMIIKHVKIEETA